MPALIKESAGKTNYFGIEVSSCIQWHKWEPGNEHTKNVVLKNVQVKTQKLTYRAPSTRFFTTLYPQPITLSAGTSYTLPVTFRPLEKTEYDDKLVFVANGNAFSVSLRAVLPQMEVSVPEHISFGACAAFDSRQVTFEINNSSELVTPFVVASAGPFSLEPNAGTMSPYSSQSITATFEPKAALVYETECIVTYGSHDPKQKVMKFEGIGKYPHLMVSTGNHLVSSDQQTGGGEAVANFGLVTVGKTVEKWVDIHNMSPVNAPFTVEQPRGARRIDTVFHCPHRSGVVPAMSSLRIPFTYSPNIVNSRDTDYFNIVAIGNISKSALKVVGESKGPIVQLSKGTINFKQVDSGQTATKTFDIINASDSDATFQFMLDCSESVFKLDHTSGVLPANCRKTIIARFTPSHPINYHRRVTCVVHHQGPLFLDLLGTCHTEQTRPAVLQLEHLQRFRTHAARGLSTTAPEELNTMLAEGQLKVDESGALFEVKDGEGNNVINAPHATVPDRSPSEEFLDDGHHSDYTMTLPHASVDTHLADFGRVDVTRNIEQHTVNVTNHTKGKVTVVWTGGEDHIFSMKPAVMDIPPMKTTSFRLTFRPNDPNQFYGAELEGYVYYKSMRDYRLVEDVTHCPPWCLTVTATGNTFQASQETFLPRYELDSNNLVLPAVNQNEAAYRTVTLANKGHTPILYSFNHNPEGAYTIKPTKGLVPPGGYQLYVVKIQPSDIRTYREVLTLRLNDADKHTQKVVAWGAAETVSVQLEHQGVMYFKPTCVGTASERHFSVTNVSRIPICFEWRMSIEDRKLLSVTPTSGVIQPNDTQHHSWSFKPTAAQKYVMKPALVAWGQGQDSATSGGQMQQFSVRAIGEGATGSISATQNYVDMGTVVVGSAESRRIVITNDSDCGLHYRLHVEQTVSGPKEYTSPDRPGLELDRSTGVLPARARHVIQVTVRPQRRLYYQFHVSYELLSLDKSGKSTPSLERHHLLHVMATGVYPTMSVTDARCHGNVGISKKQLWNLFSLDTLNSCLDAEPSAAEVEYTMRTRSGHQRRPSVHTRSIMDFNFSAAPVGSAPCVVQLMLENTGAARTEWAFLFPADLQIELEYWTETGEFTEEELHEMKVMDNKLFSVEPSRGQLAPGECQSVTLEYRHRLPGTDRLPVLLKIAQGREILLNFIGVTVEPDKHYIHFPTTQHTFLPVAVGEKSCPAQVYELYNGGSLPVKYKIDATPLDILKEQNYGQSVLECLDLTGTVEPGTTACVRWMFSPLEARTYTVDVPIDIEQGDTVLVTFTAVGFDRRADTQKLPISTQSDLTGVPTVQSVTVPGQLCYLSQERIAFGNLPLFSKGRRMIILSNRSSAHAVSFKWHATSQDDLEFVSIEPSRGMLPANGCTICSVTFIACGIPSFYDLDLVCDVYNETEMEAYRHAMSQWIDLRERGKVEFTVTEHDLDADLRIADTSRPPSGRLKSLNGRTPSPDENISHKYTALPPIAGSTGKSSAGAKVAAAPAHPAPFVLHLGVTARTHDVKEFQCNFPAIYNNYYIDRSLATRPVSRLAVEDCAASCVEAEADLVADTVANVLRGLLDDTNFHHAISKITEESTPYFRQYTECPPEQVVNVQDYVSPELPATPTSLATPEDEHPLIISVTPPQNAAEAGQGDVTQDDGHLPAAAPVSSVQVHPLVETPPPQEEAEEDVEVTSSGEVSAEKHAHVKFNATQSIKKKAEFGNLLDGILENAIKNIMQEALSNEINITARPRQIALLPKTSAPKK